MSTNPRSTTADRLSAAIQDHYLADENTVVKSLLAMTALDPPARDRIAAVAGRLVVAVRQRQQSRSGLDAFLREYDLSSREGVVLMCIAEALLRIPDAATADRLIRGKLAAGEWQRHLGHSRSLLVNASTWGLLLTGRLATFEDSSPDNIAGVLRRLIARSGEPVIRRALQQAMRILGDQFVLGESIELALERRRTSLLAQHRVSFDMLGEAALTRADAEQYFASYAHAIAVIGAAHDNTDTDDVDSISVKLSALHPRFEMFQKDRVVAELTPLVLSLAQQCREAGIDLTIDAEEADRLELTLDIFRRVLESQKPGGWHGLGIAVQAYQKRAVPVINWLADLARQMGRRIPLRLVKGAYWDTEIKRAQQQGLANYPVYTHKAATDISYLACARVVLGNDDVLRPQFATHNAHTVAAIYEMAGKDRHIEFQRLHGMGDDLYEALTGAARLRHHCRVYAPVGNHKELLPYLVRRLLENGANTSFVNRIANEAVPVADIVADPVRSLETAAGRSGTGIPLPGDLYVPERKNSHGINLADTHTLNELATAMHHALQREWLAQPIIDGRRMPGQRHPVTNPADANRTVGAVIEADEAMAEQALDVAEKAFYAWNATPVEVRAACLERSSDLFEQYRAELMALCVAEAGKTIPDALAEVREAVDYCRYYAAQARQLMSLPHDLASVTGESNKLALGGRGVYVCISPWNFPLAIFTGQVVAALVTGNTVIAKPAEQTPLVAARAAALMLEAGIPPGVLGFLPGRGDTVGARLCRDHRTSGVVFTGSTATALTINRSLADRDTAIAPLIAETGGQNVMIVDSSALTEQVVRDAIKSAFNSAGQRCSALRVLYLQEDIADQTIAMLRGAMTELRIGDPALPVTDVGPVIDRDALQRLTEHIARMDREAQLICRTPVSDECGNGTFLVPHAYELASISQLSQEVFGPILHVIRYRSDQLDAVIDAINRTGYGLTLGIHSRVDETVEYISRRVCVGNIYVNRDMIGAVVGAQPFGGQRLSGTGPKAGGPGYLQRFVTETTMTVNTAAIGGNAALLTSGADVTK